MFMCLSCRPITARKIDLDRVQLARDTRKLFVFESSDTAGKRRS